MAETRERAHRHPKYKSVAQHSPGTTVIVPPRKDAVLSGPADGSASQRDRHIEAINKVERFR